MTAQPSSSMKTAAEDLPILPPESAGGQGGAALAALDSYLELVASLAEQAADRDEFYLPLLKKLPLVAAVGECGLLAGLGEQLNLAYFFSPSDQTETVRRQARGLLEAAGKLVGASRQPLSGVELIGNFKLAAQPGMLIGCQPEGQPELYLAVVFREPLEEPVQAMYRELLEELARLILRFESRNTVRLQRERTAETQVLSKILLNLASARSLREMSMSFVNDIAIFTQADRVSLFDARGHLLAISHVSHTARRSLVIRKLSGVARCLSGGRESLSWVSGEPSVGSRRVRSQLERLVDLTGAQAVLGRGRVGTETAGGTVLAEYLGSAPADWLERNRRLNGLLDFCGPVFGKALELHSIPLARQLAWFFRTIVNRPVRSLLSLSGLGIALWLLSSWLVSTSGQLEIAARGQLFPQRQVNLFAPVSGRIQSVRVAEGTQVEAGQVVLEMESTELAQRGVRIRGELQEALKQLELARTSEQLERGTAAEEKAERETIQLGFEIQRAEIRVNTLQELLERNRQQLSELSLRAPLAGTVTSRQVETTLRDRPVETGQFLLNIADLDASWEVTLEVEERRVSHVWEAFEASRGAGVPLEVRLKLSSAPLREFRGQVREIDFTGQKQVASPEALRTTVKIFAEIEEREFGELLRLGAGVDARVVCGERSLLFLLTYELRDKLNEWFFFWR